MDPTGVSRPSRLAVSNHTVGEQEDSLEEGCLSVPLQEKGVASEERIRALEAEVTLSEPTPTDAEVLDLGEEDRNVHLWAWPMVQQN